MAAVDYEVRGHVAVVTLNRPEARNAMNPEVIVRLAQAWTAAEDDPEVRVAILTGTGNVFCSGADLARLITLMNGARQPEDEWDFAMRADPAMANRATLRVTSFSKPIIAAINGTAVAGGCELVQGTDIRVAADHARFGLQEVKWALFPAGGSTVRVPRQIPMAWAMEWLLTGDLVDADTALRLGFVNRVVPADQVMDTAMGIAEKIAANGPLAVKAIKAAVKACAEVPVEADAMKLESSFAGPVFASNDAKEGPRAFLEKRSPNFTGT
jgi:enoyl-CoA hydratase